MPNLRITTSRIKLTPVPGAVLLLACLIISTAVAAATGTSKPAWVEGRILVKGKAGLPDDKLVKILSRANGRAVSKLEQIGTHIVEVPPQAEEAVIRALSSNPHIDYAEKDMLVEPSAVTPNDPGYSSQWSLPKIQAPDAWETTTGQGITIAILDTGVQGSHPDLVNNLVPGRNVVNNNGDTSPVTWHGTSAAGTVAATGNNATGVASVAWNARIMPIRITNRTDGVASYSDMASGFIWAADHGAGVANLSYGLSTNSSTVNNAAQYLRSLGGIAIHAAGNNNGDKGLAENPYLITVAATTSSDARASYSNYGDNIDVAAPGSSIYTTYINSGYNSVSGTSFASPTAAGVVALIMAANPGLSPDEVEAILESSANDLGSNGRDPLYGHGRVNAAAAVQLAMGGTIRDLSPPTVAFASPANGATVSGTVPVDITAADNIGVQRVELYAGGDYVGTDLTRPYGFSWDSAGVVAGVPVTLTAHAHDAAGNVGETSITVTRGIDLPPVVTAPPPVSKEATGALTSVNLGTATAFDDVDGAVPVTANPAGPFAVGLHTVVWTATDSSGNTGSAQQRVTITDTRPPVIIPPADITQQASGVLTHVNLGQARAEDLVDGEVTAVPDTTGPFPVGTTVVNWTASDDAGNIASARQQITVLEAVNVAPSEVVAQESVADVGGSGSGATGAGSGGGGSGGGGGGGCTVGHRSAMDPSLSLLCLLSLAGLMRRRYSTIRI